MSKITASNVKSAVLFIPQLTNKVMVTEVVDENRLSIPARKDNTLLNAAFYCSIKLLWSTFPFKRVAQ